MSMFKGDEDELAIARWAASGTQSKSMRIGKSLAGETLMKAIYLCTALTFFSDHGFPSIRMS